MAGTTDFTAISQGSFISFLLRLYGGGKVFKYDACHIIMTCVIEVMEEMTFKKTSSPFSPQKSKFENDKAPKTHVTLSEQLKSRKLAGDSAWLSQKMISDGYSLRLALQVMKERCKDCSIITPMTCVEQCETWKVKKELHKTTKLLAEPNHRLKLLNTIKNKRRLTILNILKTRSLSIENLQKKLKDFKYSHSRKTIHQYIKPLINEGLVKETNERLTLTLYGQKIIEAVRWHSFEGQLPINSRGKEERILKSLLDGTKTRGELLQIAPTNSLSRVLERLRKLNLMYSDSPSDRILYFRTKRPTHLERISPTQKRICAAIPQAGTSARTLSKSVGINLRRTYKYLRNLRGKKLVFRREVPHNFKLTEKGRKIAEFLEEIAEIE